MAEKKRKGLLFDEVLPQARRTAQSLLSLDPQEDVPASQQALEMALGFVPGIGQAMALRDIERARRAEDPTAGALAAASLVPFGRLLGRGRSAGPIMSELDVYHGTPHRFPATEANPLGEFDASKIGTGEGAQAYGHGVYLAESPNIAKHYQTQLGKFYDQMQTPEGAMSLEEAVTKYHPDGKAAAKVLSTFRNKTDVDTFNKVINDEILPEIRAKYPQSEWSKFAPQQGTLYKADLPDEMIDRMLDWDKPLSEQPAAVKNLFPTLEEAKAINAEMIRLSEATLAANDINGPAQAAWEAMYKSPKYKMAQIVVDEADPKLGKKFANGQRIYRALSGGDDKASAEQLRSLGIPGIKYADAGSRGQGGTGTRNFVVFPGEEKKVKILERK